MEGGGGAKGSSPQSKAKFSVYQNPAFSAALTAISQRPTKSTFIYVFSVSAASLATLLSIFYGEDGIIDDLRAMQISKTKARFLAKTLLTAVSVVFLGTLIALVRVLLLHRARKGAGVSKPLATKREEQNLTTRQLELLGLKPKSDSEPTKKPPKSMSHTPLSPSDVLVPLHHSASSSHRSPQIGSDKRNPSTGMRVAPYAQSVSPGSPSLFLVSPSSHVPSSDRKTSSPWSKQRPITAKKIETEEMLEQFLADVDEKIMDSVVKAASPTQSHMTPPPTLHGLRTASPSTIASSTTTSGTARSTPLMPVRMSPGSQKYIAPPKKGEGDLPLPMSMEHMIEVFENLGIYPDIEQWRDRLRQWFSSVLLNPLVEKIETSHIQVMQAAAKIGISINISKVGSDSLKSGASASLSPVDGAKEWNPSFMLDEDGLLYQLRAALVQARDAQSSSSGLQHQQNPWIPVIQECIDAITEHQRLQALMKGDWVKGLLPQSSVRADYTVQRVRELAEGTCLKNYEYLGNGEVYDKVNKKWTLELPTDSHLLLYLFCAFLEHPKWMLHVDPSSYATAQSGKNPLFLGFLPPKERFSERYLAVVSSVPSVIHPGASVLVVGKQSPPIFALYWDKKLQFSLQGRAALWDTVLLFCYRIKQEYGGIVRGIFLGSAALNILPVLDSEIED